MQHANVSKVSSEAERVALQRVIREHHGDHTSESESEASEEEEHDNKELPEPKHRTWKVFCKEYGHQCGSMTKTATAICVALLWSTTVTTLMRAIFAPFMADYYQFSYWVGLFVISILVLGLIPVIAYKYVNSHDYWAVMLLIEILGHLWGFKVKDIITDGAYKLHHLANAYTDPLVAPNFTFCNLVELDLNITSDFVENPAKAVDQGFIGYNLDWGSYTYDDELFDGYYPYVAPSPSPSGNNHSRRELAAAAKVGKPAPSPYAGPKVDLHNNDSQYIGPGKVCAFEYKTVFNLDGFRVEKSPREAYWIELLYVLSAAMLTHRASDSLCVYCVRDLQIGHEF